MSVSRLSPGLGSLISGSEVARVQVFIGLIIRIEIVWLCRFTVFLRVSGPTLTQRTLGSRSPCRSLERFRVWGLKFSIFRGTGDKGFEFA